MKKGSSSTLKDKRLEGKLIKVFKKRTKERETHTCIRA
jgi:hypothetical protein